MRLAYLPFKSVNAFCDVATNEVFVGQRFLDGFESNILHEFAHIISGSTDHDAKFRSILDDLGGIQPEAADVFAKIRRRLGIPKSTAANIGNISGIQNILTDYHLLQAYRKFSQKTLGTYGTWEVINETAGGDATQQLIRLYPTPKGAFPVVVLYLPVITQFRSPQARQLLFDAILAEVKVAVGNARRKISNMPSPTGGTISWDGEALVNEGTKELDELANKACQLGEPMQIVMW